jgi:hypothetical protein
LPEQNSSNQVIVEEEQNMEFEAGKKTSSFEILLFMSSNNTANLSNSNQAGNDNFLVKSKLKKKFKNKAEIFLILFRMRP